jgi:hypothetical protein
LRETSRERTLHGGKHVKYKHRKTNTYSGNKVGRKKSRSRDIKKTR